MRTAIFTLILGWAAAAACAQGTELPDHAAARVGDEIITMDEFRSALLRRFGAGQEGERTLGNLVTDLLVESEARKRGVTVTDAELKAYIRGVEEKLAKLSGGKQTLKDLLKEREVTFEEFLGISRGFLLQQRMAAKDLGVTGEVSAAKLGVWLEDLKRKGGVEYRDLPDGTYARVGGRPITAKVFGDALIRQLSPDRLENTLWDLCIARAVHQRMKGWEIEITPTDVDEAMKDLEREFRRDPRFKNLKVDFAQWVQTVRRMTIEELKADLGFLSQVGLTKKLRNDLTEAEVRAHFDANREKFGEQRLFIHLLVKGEEKATPFGKASRPLPKAKAIIGRFHAEIKAGASFEEMVKKYSEARTKTVRPEDPIPVTRVSTLPTALRDIVFGATVGDVVGPVRTSYGYHLVKVLEVVPAPGYEKARDVVEDDLLRTKRRNAMLEIRQDPGIVRRY